MLGCGPTGALAMLCAGWPVWLQMSSRRHAHRPRANEPVATATRHSGRQAHRPRLAKGKVGAHLGSLHVQRGGDQDSGRVWMMARNLMSHSNYCLASKIGLRRLACLVGQPASPSLRLGLVHLVDSLRSRHSSPLDSSGLPTAYSSSSCRLGANLCSGLRRQSTLSVQPDGRSLHPHAAFLLVRSLTHLHGLDK
ncbi:hypothetical protein BD289DRAFT_361 [Coniella lustricola]|uniref:Uncharacterized protein n=1 Tax=Coniella lustricola TaxID=2025994 RepID=A0A2T3ANI3_9PEZI|nr:hypothetical protein BD289DRAFT_361 [Coniella lustricola]